MKEDKNDKKEMQSTIKNPLQTTSEEILTKEIKETIEKETELWFSKCLLTINPSEDNVEEKAIECYKQMIGKSNLLVVIEDEYDDCYGGFISETIEHAAIDNSPLMMRESMIDDLDAFISKPFISAVKS